MCLPTTPALHPFLIPFHLNLYIYIGYNHLLRMGTSRANFLAHEMYLSPLLGRRSDVILSFLTEHSTLTVSQLKPRLKSYCQRNGQRLVS